MPRSGRSVLPLAAAAVLRLMECTLTCNVKIRPGPAVRLRVGPSLLIRLSLVVFTALTGTASGRRAQLENESQLELKG